MSRASCKPGLIAILALVSVIVSCGKSSSPNTTGSKLKFRALVSNPLSPNGAGVNLPVLNIVDALQDKLAGAVVNLSGATSNPGLMAVSPNKHFTMVLGSATNPAQDLIAVVDNSTETFAQGVAPLTLPGLSESILFGVDNATGYAAVPSAPVSGQSPGAVVVLNFSASSISATLPVQGARYIVRSNSGSRILAFGSDPRSMAIITPSLVGTCNPADPLCTVITLVSGFDHPVWGVFSSDDRTAYILSCGAECGGGTARISALDLTQSPPAVTSSVTVPAATVGLLTGTTLFIAGTPPGTACGSQTCGTLTLVNVSSMTVQNPNPILITDGYHNRMEAGGNGQIYIGARTCSAACLSIFDTATSAVVIPAVNGDVTGLQPITNRSVVYVVENGSFYVYNMSQLQSTQVNIVGQPYDVKLVD